VLEIQGSDDVNPRCKDFLDILEMGGQKIENGQSRPSGSPADVRSTLSAVIEYGSDIETLSERTYSSDRSASWLAKC
jgi:hypothetical protein